MSMYQMVGPTSRLVLAVRVTLPFTGTDVALAVRPVRQVPSLPQPPLTTGVLVAVGGMGVLLGVLVCVPVAVLVAVLLGVLVTVLVGGTGVLVAVGGTGVFVPVAVSDGVLVGVPVGVLVELLVGIPVGVLVGGTSVFVGVLVDVLVGGTGVLVGVLPLVQLTPTVLELGPPPASALGLVLSQAVYWCVAALLELTVATQLLPLPQAWRTLPASLTMSMYQTVGPTSWLVWAVRVTLLFTGTAGALALRLVMQVPSLPQPPLTTGVLVAVAGIGVFVGVPGVLVGSTGVLVGVGPPAVPTMPRTQFHQSTLPHPVAWSQPAWAL
jgi:hypothetical protein